MLTISDRNHFFRMVVHEISDFGYLHFHIHEVEVTEIYDGSHWNVIGLRYDSLYRITIKELEQIRQFANGIERGQRLWTATPPLLPRNELDIKPLLGSNLLEAMDMHPMGNPVSYRPDPIHDTLHIFDTNLHIIVGGNQIVTVDCSFAKGFV